MTAALARVLMNADEARSCVSAINNHFDGARALLLALYEREGWRALGFESWRACVVACFKQSQSSLYYQLDAARTERELSKFVETPGSMPQLREYHLRQIAELPREEQRAVALELASGTGLTIKDHRRIIAQKQRDAPLREHPQVLASVVDLGDRCRIEIGDARHLPLADGVAHLVVTSPPYNARITYDGYDDWQPWEEYWHGLIESSLREAYRVLAHGGRLCLNMANVVRQDVPVPGHTGRATQYQSRGRWKYKPPGAGGESWALMLAPRLWALLEEIGFLPREQLTWVKGSPSDDEDVTATPTSSTAWGTFCTADNPVLRAVAEPIFIASKGTHSRGPGPSDLEPAEFKRWSKNVWFVSALKPETGHPSAFPEELPRRLIKLYSYPGDLVVDPFLGSGTTAVASAKLRRRSYGCDISQTYIDLARSRVARELEVAVD